MKRHKHNSRGSFIRRSSTGFTLVELSIGLVIMSMILGAIAAVTLAVGQGWQNADAAQAIQLSTGQAAWRVQRLIQSCALTGLVQAGSLDNSSALPAGIILWTGDANSDNAIQFGELAYIEQDRTDQSLYLYQPFPTGTTQAQKDTVNASPAGGYTYTNITDPTLPALFKASTWVVKKKLASYVTGATFKVLSSTGSSKQNPSLEITLTFTRNGRSDTQYHTATIRSANLVPTPGYTSQGATTQSST